MKKYILVLVLHFFVNTFAQSGSMDISFNPADVGSGNGTDNIVFSTTVQPDGKIIIGGFFTFSNGIARNRISRLNSDGSLDTGFNPGTGANGTVYSAAVQPDGKIIIGGSFTSYNGISRNYIARLNSDGSLDTDFNVGTGANSTVRSTAVQSDGKIIIGGLFTSYNGTTQNYTARLNSDGSLDTGFNPGTGANGSILSIVVQSDGKFIICGSFTSYNMISRNRIARLNSDGSLDTSFDPGIGTEADGGSILSIAVQPDGKVVIGGFFTSYNGTTRNKIARLNSDGSLDIDFDPGTVADIYVWSIVAQSDGKIIIGGFNISNNGCIARFNNDGSLDTGFYQGAASNSGVYSITVQTDGKIIIGGLFLVYNGISRNRIARLNSDGGLDTGFDTVTGANNTVNSMAIQPDGKIVIGGNFTSYNGSSQNKIARLNDDGSLDTGFNPGTGANNIVTQIAVQADGKIIISGSFAFYNGISRNGIARLNSDGSLDMSFNHETVANGFLSSISVQPDGKIVTLYYFSDNTSQILRLNGDGSLDNSFNFGILGGSFPNVSSIGVQADGKIVIGGNFTSYNGSSQNKIARLHDDGSLDTGFNPGMGADNIVTQIVVQADGKIIISGSFAFYNGISRNRIARLNSDGSLDMDFNPGTGPNSAFSTMAFQPDGKIVIGGSFASYNGITQNRIARLNGDGSLDMAFNSGMGPNNAVYSIAVQADGKIIIGGTFIAYDGIGKNRIARINGFTLTPTASAQNFCSSATVADLVATGTALQWYTTLNNGSAMEPATALATGVYYVSQTLSGIESERIAVSVTVNPLPVVTLGAFNAVCINAASFGLTGGLPSGGVYSGNGVSSGSFNPSVAGAGNHIITYTYTNSNGCSNSSTSSIQVNSPIANAGVDKSVYIGYAQEKCVILNGSATGGLAPYTYLWNTGATTAKINVCPTVTTTYTLRVTDARGCFITDDVVVKTVDITCAKNSVYICHNGITQCVKTNDIKAHLAHGDYLGTCSTTISFAKNTDTSVLENNDTFLLYPNPTNGSFTAEVCKNNVVEGAKLQVVNVLGQIIYSTKAFKIEGCIKETIELNHTSPAGVYFINLIIGENLETNELILEK
jgi:uncharacterized delta-60 repeat protein